MLFEELVFCAVRLVRDFERLVDWCAEHIPVNLLLLKEIYDAWTNLRAVLVGAFQVNVIAASENILDLA